MSPCFTFGFRQRICLPPEPSSPQCAPSQTKPSDPDRAMTNEALNPRDLPVSEESAVAALADLLIERGLVDGKTLDRARRVSTESGQRLDSVLIQLGLISERGLAESYSALLG